MQIDFKRLLRENKLIVTPARLGVLAVLAGAKQPVDIEELLMILSRNKIMVDKVTVYRVVEVLVDTSIVKQVDFREGKLRYELADKHHHHLVCNSCGGVQAVYGDNLSDFEQKIRDKYKFKVIEHALEFFGVCGPCQLEGGAYV